MKDKKYIIIILILTIILSVLLPFILRDSSESINDIISIIATLISSFASLLTLLIAIILLNKFGIETSLIEKNTEVIFSFIEEFKQTSFSVKGNNFVLMIRPFHFSPHKYSENYYSEKLIFSLDFVYSLDKLFKIAESPFMPKSIFEKINKLAFTNLSMNIADEDLDKYSIVEVLGNSLIDTKDVKYGLFNSEDMTLFEFLNLIDDLKTEIVSWIEEHSSYTSDLNI